MLTNHNYGLVLGFNDNFLKYKDNISFNVKRTILECFKQFANKNGTSIDQIGFVRLFKSIFRFKNHSYPISQEHIQMFFDRYKVNESTPRIDLNGFEKFWFQIVKQTLFPRSALLVVDVQNDFIDGTLSLKNCPSKHNGEEVVPIINNLINQSNFDVIAYTLDWHPENHCSFIENVYNRKVSEKSLISKDFKTFDTVIFEDFPQVEQKLWPAHCINETKGAELHQNLKIVDSERDQMKRKVFIAKKGVNPEIDSYSPFFNNYKLNETELHNQLQSEEITDLYICGIAYDVCVACTAFDALDLNYRVIIVNDACRGVDLNSIKYQKDGLINRGAIIVNSKQVNDMINCRDRRPELAISTLLKLNSTSPSK